MSEWRYFMLGPYQSSHGSIDYGGYVTGVVLAENTDDASDKVAAIVALARRRSTIVEWWVVSETLFQGKQG